MKKLIEADILNTLLGVINENDAINVSKILSDKLIEEYEIKPKLTDIASDSDILMPVSAINILKPKVGDLHIRSCSGEWEYCDGACEQCVKHGNNTASNATDLKYKCVAHCPELDLDGNEHCVLTSGQVVDFYNRYPDGCPCGNTPKWLKVAIELSDKEV